MYSSNINTIDPYDHSTWKDKIFITIDVDWACDEILNFTLDIIEKYTLKATIFCTHKTELLTTMRQNKNIEVGIHPNFNFLLHGEYTYGKNYKEVLEYYLDIVPEALSVRSHSMTQNSVMLQSFHSYGLKYDCNQFIPFHLGIELAPWYFWDFKLIRIPCFWEDDIHCLYKWKWNIDSFINIKGIKVFAFHPIHLFLNTNDMENFKQCRPYYNDPSALKKLRNNDYGTYSFFIDLIKKLKSG
jgi:hypothetical protein